MEGPAYLNIYIRISFPLVMRVLICGTVLKDILYKGSYSEEKAFFALYL